MTDLPAAEFSFQPADVNALVKRRQAIVWVCILLVVGVPVFLYTLHSVMAPSPNARKIEEARRQDATIDSAKAPVADTANERLSGEVRDEKQLADTATADNAALKSKINDLQVQLAADHADAERTVEALTKEVQARSSAEAVSPAIKPNLSIPASSPAPLRNSLINSPFAPVSSPMGSRAEDRELGDNQATDPSVEPHRTMTLIKATSLGDGGAPSAPAAGVNGGASGIATQLVSESGVGTGSAANSTSLAKAPGNALGGGAPSLGVKPGGALGSKGYFTGELEVYDSAKFVPPNAYATAKVLVGVDAATGTSYAADPKPVMFRITGPAVHVGADGQFQTTDLNGCMVNGAAYGELASEKVYIKLQKITCPSGGDQFSVATVEGYVASKGKSGVRGQVISREGAFTTRALIAGTLNGLGQALSTNVQRSVSGVNTTSDASGLLATKELTPGQIATGAAGTGVANAASMLADYYIKRAEQYQPVIEMPTGINVELVFLSGFQIK